MNERSYVRHANQTFLFQQINHVDQIWSVNFTECVNIPVYWFKASRAIYIFRCESSTTEKLSNPSHSVHP